MDRAPAPFTETSQCASRSSSSEDRDRRDGKYYNKLLGGYYRLHWHACANDIAEHVQDFEMFRCPHFQGEKNDREIIVVFGEVSTRR